MVEDSRIVIVGDVHGDSNRLGKLLDFYTGNVSKLVFVGDYVNRGPDSHGVLELLSEARITMGEDLVLLRGNHDQELLDFLATGNVNRLAAHGGLSTVRSYPVKIEDQILARFIAEFPVSHRRLLEETSSYYETRGLLVSHSGFDPADVTSRSESAMFRSSHEGLFDHAGPWPAPLTVCGHYVQTGGRPLDSKNLWCIDTGCGTIDGAPLTALELDEMQPTQF